MGKLIGVVLRVMVFLNLIRAVICHPEISKRVFLDSDYTCELESASRKYISLLSCQYMHDIAMAMTYLTINRDLRSSKQRCLEDILEYRNIKQDIFETGEILSSLKDNGGEDMKALIEFVYAY